MLEDGKNLKRITGVVEHIIYANEENGYTVCDISMRGEEGRDVLATLVGSMPFIAEGEYITALGDWVVHSSFGRQFKVETYEKELPANEASILRYLSSRAVKGIGPVTAEKIVAQFGVDSFDVIENHPEWLADIPGISSRKASEISESFKSQFGVRAIMMLCRDFFGPATAVKIYKRWGGASVDTIKSNPYLLCDEIYGVGFEKADRIASDFGISKNSSDRIMAGIKYLLNYNALSNGHTYIPRDKLIPASSRLLEVSDDEVAEALSKLDELKQIKVVDYDGRSCVYLKAYYSAERYSAEKLDLLDKVCPQLNMNDIEQFISIVEEENGIKYAKNQRKAIINTLTSGVMILTGGPGTGKTTVVRAVLAMFDHLGMKLVLAAPTGRAAKRMSEATQREAKTIHRLLEMEYTGEKEAVFRKKTDDPIDADVIIIDEASMVDILLLEALCKAIKPGARLLLIGDSDQLPSVGAGNVLSDIIESERFNTVRLREVFRQASESLIITNAHSINNGELPELDVKNNDFFFIEREKVDDIVSTVVGLWRTRLPRSYGEQIRNQIQVISPSRRGNVGTELLNVKLQSALNPPDERKKEKKYRDVTFREGDKVMQIRNNYDITWEKVSLTGDIVTGEGIFNGDIGIIEQIRYSDESVVVNFDDRITVYDFSQLDELEHAYAITVHKSQGSEYPVVIIPMYDYSPRLLTRNLLYTAVTRAQNMVILVGQKQVVAGMVGNNRLAHRYTGFKRMLCDIDCDRII